MALEKLPEKEQELEDIFYSMRQPTPEYEWVFGDRSGVGRFSHDGDTIVPGAGVRWSHIHKQTSTPPSHSDNPFEETKLVVCSEDDEDQLPWQVIALSNTSGMLVLHEVKTFGELK